MTKVILDDNLRAKLRNVDEVELCDESGRGLGHFLSEGLYRRLLYNWANAQVTDEELERRRQQPGGRSLAEIWTQLRDV
ncbi:MAG: hypothetical protein ACYC35_25335 [Pirellulales bacterium]